jgi:hypothetical protein
MVFITRLLVAVIGLTSLLLGRSYGAELPKETKGSLANAGRPERKPVHLVVRSRADIKQIFTYSPYPAVPSELQGYEGSQMGGTGTYRLSVDAQGAVTQVTILKGFTVTAVYDDRFSNSKGNPVPALDKVMLQALSRWRAKPGPTRVVDIYWSFGNAGACRHWRRRDFVAMFFAFANAVLTANDSRAASQNRRSVVVNWRYIGMTWQRICVFR